MQRLDGRASDSIRKIALTPDFVEHALASVLIELGKTKVLCAVSLNSTVPPFLKNKKSGWLTAEYAMLPVATHSRMQRECTSFKRQSRAVEISRLIGRVFRSIVDLTALNEQTLLIDCDVIQADGGTRTAAIIGTNYVLSLAQAKLLRAGQISVPFMKTEIAAISVGMFGDNCVLDLNYEEDSRADVDFNFVLTKAGHLIEIQGTAEQAPVSWESFGRLHTLAQAGIMQIFEQLSGMLPNAN